MAEEKKQKSIDQATIEMLDKASEAEIMTVFDRAEKMSPCPIGADGSCCKNCAMGPCRIPLGKNKEDTGGARQKGRCLRGYGGDHFRS